jgi:Carboxypeptidase regulatory-like domain
MSTQILRLPILLAILMTLLLAQTDQARIVGTITDTTGAVVPGTTITVKNEKTSQKRQITVDDEGRDIVTQLLPADYTVTAEAPGMANSEYSGVNLQVGQERTLNIALKPAAVSTEITVSGGDMSVIDISSARVSANMPEREVSSLPLNGRQVSQLYLMAPGAVNNGGGSFDNIRFSSRSNQQRQRHR